MTRDRELSATLTDGGDAFLKGIAMAPTGDFTPEIIQKLYAGIAEVVHTKRVLISFCNGDMPHHSAHVFLKDVAAVAESVEMSADGCMLMTAKVLDTKVGKDLRDMLNAMVIIGGTVTTVFKTGLAFSTHAIGKSAEDARVASLHIVNLEHVQSS